MDNHTLKDLDGRFLKITGSHLELLAQKWDARTDHHSLPSPLQGTAYTPFIYSLKPHQKLILSTLSYTALKGVTRTSQIWRQKWEAKEQSLFSHTNKNHRSTSGCAFRLFLSWQNCTKDLSCTLSCIAKTHKQSKENKISHSYRKRAKIKGLTQQSSGIWTSTPFYLIPSNFWRLHLKVTDSLRWQIWFCIWRTPALKHNFQIAHTQVERHTWNTSLFHSFCTTAKQMGE